MSTDPYLEKPDPFELNPKELPNPPRATTENERLLSALAYVSQILLPLLMPILLLANRNTRKSDFVRHHATQSIALVVVQVIYYILVVLIFLLWRDDAYVLALGVALMILAPVLAYFFYGIRALTGHWTEIPWVTNFLKDTGLL